MWGGFSLSPHVHTDFGIRYRARGWLPRSVPGMSNVWTYFPFIGASTQPSERDMQEFWELSDVPQGSKSVPGSPLGIQHRKKIVLQVQKENLTLYDILFSEEHCRNPDPDALAEETRYSQQIHSAALTRKYACRASILTKDNRHPKQSQLQRLFFRPQNYISRAELVTKLYLGIWSYELALESWQNQCLCLQIEALSLTLHEDSTPGEGSACLSTTCICAEVEKLNEEVMADLMIGDLSVHDLRLSCSRQPRPILEKLKGKNHLLLHAHHSQSTYILDVHSRPPCSRKGWY